MDPQKGPINFKPVPSPRTATVGENLTLHKFGCFYELRGSDGISPEIPVGTVLEILEPSQKLRRRLRFPPYQPIIGTVEKGGRFVIKSPGIPPSRKPVVISGRIRKLNPERSKGYLVVSVPSQPDR